MSMMNMINIKKFLILLGVFSLFTSITISNVGADYSETYSKVLCLRGLKISLENFGINATIPFNYQFFENNSKSIFSKTNFGFTRSDSYVNRYDILDWGTPTAYDLSINDWMNKSFPVKQYYVIFYYNLENKTFDGCYFNMLTPLNGYGFGNISKENFNKDQNLKFYRFNSTNLMLNSTGYIPHATGFYNYTVMYRQRRYIDWNFTEYIQVDNILIVPMENKKAYLEMDQLIFMTNRYFKNPQISSPPQISSSVVTSPKYNISKLIVPLIIIVSISLILVVSLRKKFSYKIT